MHAVVESLFGHWPNTCQQALAEHLQQQGAARIPAALVATLCQQLNFNLGQLQQQLVPLAAHYSINPLSGFAVGAVATGDDIDAQGMTDLFLGTNMEFPGTHPGTTIHAEQAVLAVCRAHGQCITGLALNATPCGHCRQFLYEFHAQAALPISLPEQVVELQQLLPSAFGPADLEITENHAQACFTARHDLNALAETLSLNELAQCAQEDSHAPYSGQQVGIAIEMASGRRYAGSYLENAAYNPYMNPLSAALAVAHMSQPEEHLSQIQSVVLSQSESTDIDLTQSVRLLLQTLNPDALLQS